MKYKHIFVISPPFYSHFNPLIVLAKSLKKQGSKVTIGCSREFEEKVLAENLEFYEIDISSNKNVGEAESTDQPDAEKERLDEFFKSTEKGAIETLITQSRHRKADMLYNPGKLIHGIREIDQKLNVDLYVVDILSYSVTLALYYLNLPFITYCPPHPDTIPVGEAHYGVPKNWPSAIKVSEDDVSRLKQVSEETQKEFTQVFNQIIRENKDLEETNNAFSLVSNIGTVYNYFDFYGREGVTGEPFSIYAANSFTPEKLEETWIERIKTKDRKIMITLGTFLSYRKDVLEKLIVNIRKIYPDALLVVSAGANAKHLSHLRTENTIIEDFIPQIALMPYIDTVIFHGGCNTFTEAMYYGKKMMVLPFSSDQFNIAYDVEKNKLGSIEDPNNFNQQDLEKAFEFIDNETEESIKYWSEISKERGADYAAKIILSKE